jgi:hypothetical protein
MGRQPRGAGCAGEHDAEHVGVLVLVDQRAEREQLGGRAGREPSADVAVGRGMSPDTSQAAEGIPYLRLEDELVVPRRLDAHEQAVERGDVDAGRLVAALQGLHQRRPRAGEGVEY